MIIPVYNAEKYIAECLESVLNQTFQNFEVIVVDDCSTDNSCAIVESYAPKFGGRLQLSHMKKNSGGAGFPRNKGVKISCGEYIYFLDPDDTITKTALEELYTLAKKFDADVVHCEKNFAIPQKHWNDKEYRKNLKPSSWPTGNKIFITEPTLLTEDFAQRAVDFSKRWLTWSVCFQMLKRKFIVENEIAFEDIICEDMLFVICEICSAKKYLVVPNVIYFARKRDGSAIRSHLNIFQIFQREIKALKHGIKYLDEFLSDTEIFSSRPDLKYILFDMFAQEILSHLYAAYSQIPPYALDEIIRKEFNASGNVALTSFIFNTMNIQRLQLMQAQQRIAQLESELMNRIR